jgi:DNA-binding transcriptional regulator YdaS (Cro superfamily)
MARDPVLVAALQTRLAVQRIARLCGISSAAVSQWNRVPERHVWAVSKVTGIPAAELRPDLKYYRPPPDKEAAE